MKRRRSATRFRRYLPNRWEVRHAIGCVVVLGAIWLLWNLAELGVTSLTADEQSAWQPDEGASAASDHEVKGQASVVDGDTLDIHGERIRILDVDAPESKQTCTRPDGIEWRCGQQAALKLAGWIGQRIVTCEASRKDRYGRWLAHCEAGGEDMAQWLASRGWAVPYRECKCELVREASARAQAASAGIWASTFQMPWDWRKAN